MGIECEDQFRTLEMGGGRREKVHIYVLGTMSVTAGNDRSCTPRSKKACALLALLALAPRGQRTRVWLRDKLWSCSDEKKSSTSLRQTVFELKRDLGSWASQILVIERLTIGLALDRVWIDIREIDARPALFHDLGLSPDTELLEGLDVADEEFEDWLQMERQIWYDKASNYAELPRNQAPQVVLQESLPDEMRSEGEWEAAPLFSLGLLPNIQHGCDANTRHLADYILEGVAKNLRELEPVAIFDFRDPASNSDFVQQTCETDYYTRVRVLQVRDTISITFFLYRTLNMSLEWSQTIQAPVAEALDDANYLMSGFIAQTVDRLAKSLFAHSPNSGLGTGKGNSIGFAALNMMFQLDNAALQKSELLLQSAYRHDTNTIYPALQSYLLSFKVGENVGEFDEAEVRNVRRHIADIVNSNPFNSHALACLGHVMGYVFKDHVVAGELLHKALELNPNQAFVWDHYALHKLYTGDCAAAFEASKRAVRLGAYSPIRFSYDTTLCMTAMLTGHLEMAVMSGKSAVGKQPRFTAAMRYLTASYGLLGRHDEARDMFQRLLQVDPDFELPEVRKERFRIINEDVENRVLGALPHL